MGDRAQVKIVSTHEDEPPVFLYTHWGARELVDVVGRAIARGERWNDMEYLGRIVFEQMLHDLSDPGRETGLGIGTRRHGDIWREVVLDLAEQKCLVYDHGDIRESVEFDRMEDVYTPTDFTPSPT